MEHNLTDDEISDFAMLYRDHCEVRKVVFASFVAFAVPYYSQMTNG